MNHEGRCEMDWFNGWLELKRKDGKPTPWTGATEKIHDLSLARAQALIEEQGATIEWAIYHPSSLCMK
jgi:hypothetical protein